MIPEGWSIAEIGQHVEVLTGFAFKSADYTDQLDDIRLLRGDNIAPGRVRWDNAKKWPLQKSDGLDRFALKVGDFVVALDRTWVSAGLKIAEVKQHDVPSYLVQRVARLRAGKNLHQGLLRQLFATDDFERHVKDMQTETLVPHISPNDLRNYEVLLPPLPEQRRITAVLDAWDDAIASGEKLVAAKEQRFDWIRANVLIGKARLPGFDKPWKTIAIGKALTEHGQTSTGREEVHSVSVHHGLINQIEHLGRSFAAANTDHYNRVLPGDIVYTKSPTGDFPLGIIKQSRLDKAAIVSPLYGVFTATSRELGTIMDTLFASPAAVERLLAPVVQKGAKNTIAVTNKNFLKAQLHLPTDQREIVALSELVEAARAELDVHKAELKLLRNQKRGLMQKLLTGQWRVPESIDALLPAASEVIA